jgi:glycosyltransferase involved in cell wall biosynthesis
MKVLFTISSTIMGGAEKQLIYLISEAKKHHECSLVILDSEGSMTRQYRELGVEVFECKRENKFGIPNQIIKIRKIIRNRDVDVIQSFLYESDILVSLASIGLRRKLFWTAGNVNIPNFAFRKKAILALFSRIFPEKIFPNSEQALDFHTSIGYPIRKMEIVDNFLPSEPESTIRSNLEARGKGIFKIGMAARPVQGKGHQTLIRAVEYAASLGLIMQVEFIGDGIQEWEYLLQEKEKSPVCDQIILLPKRSSLTDWYNSLDCYVMASEEWESFPNTLTEAIFLECPVISSDIAGIAQGIFGIRQTFPSGNAIALGKLLKIKVDESETETRSETNRLKKLLLVKYSNVKTFSTWESFWTRN